MTGKKLRVIFMGTPDFSVPALNAILSAGHKIIAVYSQPPRPRGRGQKIQPSPVHAAAEVHNIPVFTPLSLKKDEAAQEAFAGQRADVAVVVAYGLLLPRAVLEAPVYGCLNIHASRLPRWRGASPIQRAIWAGDSETGVSIMKMDEGLDTGPVLAERGLAIGPQTTAQSLHDDLSALGAELIVSVLDQIAVQGRLPPATAQDNKAATYAALLTREDSHIDWTKTAAEIDRQIRALNPWPGVWTTAAGGRRLKIVTAEIAGETPRAPPGTLEDRSGLVSCGGKTALRLLQVQPENAAVMGFSAALSGRHIEPGSNFF